MMKSDPVVLQLGDESQRMRMTMIRDGDYRETEEMKVMMMKMKMMYDINGRR